MTKKEIKAANLLIALTIRDIYPYFVKDEQVFNVWTSEFRSTIRFDRDLSALDVACSGLKIKYDYGNAVRTDTYLKVLEKCMEVGRKDDIINFFNSINKLALVKSSRGPEGSLYNEYYNFIVETDYRFNSAAKHLFKTSVENHPNSWKLPKFTTNKLLFLKFWQTVQLISIIWFAYIAIHGAYEEDWLSCLFGITLSIANVPLLYDSNREYVQEKLKCRRIGN